MGKTEKDPSSDEIPHTRKEPRPDFSKSDDKDRKLPQDLQKLVDSPSIFDDVVTGNAGSTTDSSVRYAAYATRLRTILLSAHRYVAYTSDIGESFRPIAHPYLVSGAYAVSWAYLIGDVSHEGYKAYTRNQQTLLNQAAGKQLENPTTTSKAETGPTSAAAPNVDASIVGTKAAGVSPLEDWRTVAVQRAVFQSIASMGLPAFTVHSIVRYSGQAMKNMKNKNIRTWGPIGLGLAVVPLLPYAFDEPVEEAIEWGFTKAFELYGGKDAIRRSEESKKTQ